MKLMFGAIIYSFILSQSKFWLLKNVPTYIYHRIKIKYSTLTCSLHLDVLADTFEPKIKRIQCQKREQLCLEVCFKTETDIAILKQKYKHDQANFEGHFTKRPNVRVFASAPHSNFNVFEEDSILHVCRFLITFTLILLFSLQTKTL